MLDAIWGVMCIIIVMINFISNRYINTNCRYIYIGNIIIVLGSLVGLSSRPVMAGSIVFIGALVVIWAVLIHQGSECKHKILK